MTVFLGALIFFLIFFSIPTLIMSFLFLKKKFQVGKTWSGRKQATVTINEKELQCSHCQHNKFDKREVIISTTWVLFFRLGFLNQSTPSYVCRNCGCIQWFVHPKERATIHRNCKP